MLPVFSVIHVLLAAALVGLILMHSGRDTGMAGMGYVPQSQGGTHIVERNLSRLTIVVSAEWASRRLRRAGRTSSSAT